MLSTTLYRLRRISRKLWVRAGLVAGLGLIAPLVLGVAAPLVPDKIAEAVTAESVEKILEILASSMLAVTIFSLSVMVSARQSASSQVTPRSHQLLLEDTTTQTVQATFLGAFVFSLFGLITLSTGYTSQRGAVVMLGFTLLVIAMVVLAILRWIDHLTRLGSVLETTRRVEDAARSALSVRADWPCLGAQPYGGTEAEIPDGARTLRAPRAGYVQHLDVAALSELAEDNEIDLYLAVQPGSFLSDGAILLHHSGDCDEDDLFDAFTLGDARVYDQDPRFGVIVLSEIAQRALSPGINDPGTAIDVITRLHRLLDRGKPSHADVEYPRVRIVPITPEALMRDGFDPIARDGAAMIEVQIRLRKALLHLARSDDPALARAAREAAERAFDRAERALALAADLERLKQARD